MNWNAPTTAYTAEQLYQAIIRRMSDERLIYGPMNLTTKEREALEKRIDDAEDDLG